MINPDAGAVNDKRTDFGRPLTHRVVSRITHRTGNTSADDTRGYTPEVWRRSDPAGGRLRTCQSGAMSLSKLETERVPPRDTMALYTQIYRERCGTLGLARAAGRRLLGLKV